LGEFYADAEEMLKKPSTHSNHKVTAVSKAQHTALLVHKEYELALNMNERAVNTYKLELSAMSQR
jgi:hypothetical protein